MDFPKVLLVLTGVLLFTCVSSGEVLVQYDFTGYNGLQEDTPAVKGSTVEHLTASAITRSKNYPSPGNTSSFLQDSMGFSPTDADGLFLSPYTIDMGVSNDGYFEIILTVAPGYKVSVDSIQLGTKRATRRTGPNYFVVRSSVDNFTADLASGDCSGLGGDDALDITLNFAGQLSNVSERLVLRFYGWGRLDTDDRQGIWAIANNSAAGGLVIEGKVR